jgi:hypothetical protein
VTFDIKLVQSPAGDNHSLRLIQFDFSDSDAALTLSGFPTHPLLGITFWRFNDTGDGAGVCSDEVDLDCGEGHGFIDSDLAADDPPLPPRTGIVSIAFGKDVYMGEDTSLQFTLPGDGSELLVTKLRVDLPNPLDCATRGALILDALNAGTANADAGAQVHWGFGTNINGEMITGWKASAGEVTGGEATYNFCVDEPDANLVSSTPDCGGSLWRSQNNVALLDFDADLPGDPASGEIQIRPLLAGGTFGADLSGSFTLTVENDGGGLLRRLRIKENGSVLTHRTWYGITHNGWTGVSPFEVDYVLQVGDVNGDGRVLSLDVGVINTGIPCLDCPDDRRDTNGDNRILSLDVGVVNGSIPSLNVPKPDGHVCNP